METSYDPEDIERELEKKVIFLDNFDEVSRILRRDYKTANLNLGGNPNERFKYRGGIVITLNKTTSSISVSEYSPELIEDLKSDLYIKIKKFNFKK